MSALLQSLVAENKALKAELDNLKALQAAKNAGSAQAAVDEAKEVPRDTSRLAALFAYYDSDKSGFIDRSEFELLVADLGEIQSDEELSANLTLIDSSGDGKISLQEFTEWFDSADRPRASQKSLLQSAIMKLKLNAKLLAIKAKDAVSKSEEKQNEAAGPQKVVYDADIALGVFPGAPAMTLKSQARFPSAEEVQSTMQLYGGSGVQMFSVQIAMKDDASEADVDEIIGGVEAMYRELPIPDFIEVKFMKEQTLEGMFIRYSIFIKEGAPIEAIPDIVISMLRELEYSPSCLEMAWSPATLLSNPDACLVDLFTMRGKGSIKWDRNIFNLLAALAPQASAASLFAGVSLRFELGDIKSGLRAMLTLAESLRAAAASDASASDAEAQAQAAAIEGDTMRALLASAPVPESEELLAPAVDVNVNANVNAYWGGSSELPPLLPEREVPALLCDGSDGSDAFAMSMQLLTPRGDDLVGLDAGWGGGAARDYALDELTDNLKVLLTSQPDMVAAVENMMLMNVRAQLDAMPEHYGRLIRLLIKNAKEFSSVRMLLNGGYDAFITFTGLDIFSPLKSL